MLDPNLAPAAADSVVHVIQVALAPAFLLSALATLLNVFSTRLGRVADLVDGAVRALDGADAAGARRLAVRLAHLRRRSFLLDAAVVLASVGGGMTGIAVLTLFVGALRDASAAALLFASFGAALVCTVLALAAFLAEILLAGRGVRVEADRRRGEAGTRADEG